MANSQTANSRQQPEQDREIVINRTFDAPRELVWKAWTDSNHLVQWWGPQGFGNTTLEFNFEPGGVWRFTMHGPDGTDYPNRITYIEIDPPERLVYAVSSDSDDADDRFETTVTLTEHDGKTLLTMRSLFPSAAVRDYVVREHNAVEGGKQTLARLAVHLETMAAK